MSEQEEIVVKASELLSKIFDSSKRLESEVFELKNRIKNIELINKMLVTELRKQTLTNLPQKEEQKVLEEPLKQEEVNTSDKPIGLITQKLVWSDGTPVRMAFVELISHSGIFRKKFANLHSGSWQKKDVPFGEYDLLITRDPSGDRPAINYKTSFTFSQSPLNLGTLKLD